MAESNKSINNNVSINDALDINELASLNDEISSDFIEQLQSKITNDNNTENDGNLFEEVSAKKPKEQVKFNSDIDDNFIKKYKAKLKKLQQTTANDTEQVQLKHTKDASADDSINKLTAQNKQQNASEEQVKPEHTQNETQIDKNNNDTTIKQKDILQKPQAADITEPEKKDSINAISGGYINEKPLSKEDTDYMNSLDYLDNNVKYSKYVIYIEPENKEFIDSLTVKERKNLINRIIHEQDSIAVTKQRLNKMQTIITHFIIAIITITISIPILYWIINTSLEVTINNYRQSQSLFETLYKDNGKLRRMN